MTNSIVWDLKKSWNEKGTHFCYKIHEKNSSNRNATWYKWVLVLAQHVTNTHLYPVALRFDEFFSWTSSQKCHFSFPDFFPIPIQWNWSWIFCYFLKNFWAYFWLESKTMVFVRSSKVTNGWLVTIRDPESVIVTLQGFLGVTYGYQFHWSLSRTLQMIHWSLFKIFYLSKSKNSWSKKRYDKCTICKVLESDQWNW